MDSYLVEHCRNALVVSTLLSFWMVELLFCVRDCPVLAPIPLPQKKKTVKSWKGEAV